MTHRFSDPPKPPGQPQDVPDPDDPTPIEEPPPPIPVPRDPPPEPLRAGGPSNPSWPGEVPAISARHERAKNAVPVSGKPIGTAGSSSATYCRGLHPALTTLAARKYVNRLGN